MRTEDMKDNVEGLLRNGKHEKAYQRCRKLLSLTIAEMGPKHVETARAHNLLGTCHAAQGRHGQAAREYFKALSIVRAAHRWPGSVDEARFLTNIALLWHARLDTKNTEACFIMGAEVLKTLCPPDSNPVADFLKTYSLCTSNEKTAGRSEEAAARAVHMAEYMYGTGYLSGLGLENLAAVYEEEDRMEEARLVLLHVLELYNTIFGASHSHYGGVLIRLAPHFERVGDLSRAIRAYETCLGYRDRATWSDREVVLENLDKLASLREKAKDLIGAQEAWECLVERCKIQEGMKDSQTADALDKLGDAYLQTDQYEKAVRCFEEAVSISRNHVSCPDVLAGHLYDLANAYQQRGTHEHAASLKKADKTYQEALSLGREAFGGKDEQVATILAGLASLHAHLERWETARKLYEEALQIRKVALGASHDLVASTTAAIGNVLMATGEWAGATKTFRRALDIREGKRGGGHVDLTGILNNLAVCLAAQKDHDRAVRMLDRAIRIHSETFGPRSGTMTGFLQNKADIQAVAGDAKGAKTTYEHALEIIRTSAGPKRHGRKDAGGHSRRREAGQPESNEILTSIRSLEKGRSSKRPEELWRMDVDTDWAAMADPLPGGKAVI